MVGKELGVFTDDEGVSINVSAKNKWHFDGEPLETGKDKVLARLYADEDLCSAVEVAVYEAIDLQNQRADVSDVIPNPIEEPELEEIIDLDPTDTASCAADFREVLHD